MTTAHGWQQLTEAFGLGAAAAEPEYITRGSMGEIWRLETAGGRWAVKWQFPWAETDAKPPDVPIQLAAAAAGIPLPRPVTTADGAAVVRAGDRYARVYEWIELGEPLTPPIPASAAAEAGRLLGLLHGLALPADEPVDPWYTQVPGADHWADLNDRAAAAGAQWAPALAAAHGLIGELSALVVAPSGRPPIACHRDFNPENVHPVAADGRLAVLDWENAGPLDPVLELGYAVFTWCSGDGQFDPATADALLAAYAAASGSAPEPGADFFATAIATHVNFLHAMAEQALSEPEHRSYAEEAIADSLDCYLGQLQQVVRLSPEGWEAADRVPAPARSPARGTE